MAAARVVPWSFRGAALLAALGPLAGCVIPVPRATLVRPAGVVVVRDAATQRPIAAARVVVRRFNLGPPPRRESHRFTAATGVDGQARFTAVTGHEWVMPLMMHGVPQWAFDVCVDAPGYQGQPVTWLVQGMWTEGRDQQPQPDLVVPLRLGAGACEDSFAWKSFMTQVLERQSP